MPYGFRTTQKAGQAALLLLCVFGLPAVHGSAAPDQPLAPDATGPVADGYDDLFVGTGLEDVGTVSNAGAVNVLHGSAGGLTAVGNQLWYQGLAGFPDEPETDDQFGHAVAAGDFNGDYRMDLAINVPLEDFDIIGEKGGVHILYGTAGGLGAAGTQFWYPGLAGIPSGSDWVFFGYSLAAGDYNRDGFTDLAVGAPYRTVSGLVIAGEVYVLFGSSSGLAAAGLQTWNQNSGGLEDGAEANDGFGMALAAADFNRDSYADLAIGVPRESVGTVSQAGAVQILFGSPGGLVDANDQIWSQDTAGVEGQAETDDSFGFVLAAGDFNGDDFADLAVSAQHEVIGSVSNAGAVNILYGSPSGLTAAGNRLLYQGLNGLEGVPDSSDEFGSALAAGDINQDGHDDLAIGVPRERSRRLPTGSQVGGFQIVYGSPSGLTGSGDQLWIDGSAGIQLSIGDFMGDSIAFGDYNGDGYGDLAIGIPRVDIFTNTNAIIEAGQVMVVFGTAAGLDAAGMQTWDQGSPNVLGDPEYSDRFGSVLASSHCPTCTRLLYLPLVGQ